jgi:hypothetical protein
MGWGNGMSIGWPMASTGKSNPGWPNMSLLVEPNVCFDIPAYTFGQYPVTSDFTIEWFQYLTDDTNHPRVWSIGSWPNAVHAVSIENGFFYYWINGTIVMSKNINSESYLGKWSWFVIQRNGPTINAWFQGTQFTSTDYSDAIPSNGLPLYLGSEGNDSLFNGCLSNFRWSNEANYMVVAELLVPNSPLTNNEGVQLLVFQGNTLGDELTDNSNIHNTIVNATGIYSQNNPFSGYEYEGSIQFGTV